MQKFTEKIVRMMKEEKLFETQGGPIILSQVCLFSYQLVHNVSSVYPNESLFLKEKKMIFTLYVLNGQIENEYGPIEWEIGAPGKAYTKWVAEMAQGLSTGVPWIMCKQDDAPNSIVCSSSFFLSLVITYLLSAYIFFKQKKQFCLLFFWGFILYLKYVIVFSRKSFFLNDTKGKEKFCSILFFFILYCLFSCLLLLLPLNNTYIYSINWFYYT